MVAWYGGTRESDPDTAIWGSTLDDNGWNRPRLLAKVSDDAHWNPVLFRAPDGVVHLYFKVGRSIPRWETWHGVIMPNGKVFSDLSPLVPGDTSGGRGPVRNKMVVLSDGTWLAPASHERKMYYPTQDVWDAFVDLSTDGGRGWSRMPYVGRPTDKGGVIQPAVWESSGGNVHMLLRSTDSVVYRSDSADMGRTWTQPHGIGVPNNNSAVDVVKLSDGLLAMVYNPVAGNWAARTPISVAFSRDNGLTWGHAHTLEHSLADKAGFAYPSAIRSADGIWVSYTWNRVGIRCIEVKIEDRGAGEPIIRIVEDMSVPKAMEARLEERKRMVAQRALGVA